MDVVFVGEDEIVQLYLVVVEDGCFLVVVVGQYVVYLCDQLVYVFVVVIDQKMCELFFVGVVLQLQGIEGGFDLVFDEGKG